MVILPWIICRDCGWVQSLVGRRLISATHAQLQSIATCATDAHITIAGHITEQELKRELTECDLFNGFANRFLWLLVKRSQFLPEGGKLSEEEEKAFQKLTQELRGIVDIAVKITEMTRDDDARALWRDVYPKLSEEAVGLVGAVINRAEAQVLRLSMIYALSDGSAVIRRRHLEAALAFWDYCRASAYFLFGARLENQNAQKILDALKARPTEGMRRKDIFDKVFQKHISKAEMEFALNFLEAAKLARKEEKQTGGEYGHNIEMMVRIPMTTAAFCPHVSI